MALSHLERILPIRSPGRPPHKRRHSSSHVTGIAGRYRKVQIHQLEFRIRVQNFCELRFPHRRPDEGVSQSIEFLAERPEGIFEVFVLIRKALSALCYSRYRIGSQLTVFSLFHKYCPALWRLNRKMNIQLTWRRKAPELRRAHCDFGCPLHIALKLRLKS